MAIYDFRIGAAPDFMMTKGKVIYPHKADVELAFHSGAKSSVMVSNPSLSALIVGIKEKLVAIGWSNKHGHTWTKVGPLTVKVQGRNGIGTVAFKFQENMGATQQPTMVQHIKSLFIRIDVLPK